MRIVADADILAVKDTFSDLGELQLVPGREIRQHHLINADILLVRSITRVDAELLAGTRVRLVGTATSGVDHVDQQYLAEQGIRFCAAGGCNANAVVDYCFAALSQLSEKRHINFFDRTIALIGAGHVGSLFADRLTSLQIDCLVCDPLLQDGARSRLLGMGVELVELEEALQADVVSLHVPLTRRGAHPTWHLLDKARLSRLKQNCVLLNTARGPVVDNVELRELLAHREDLGTVLDVWEGEPQIDAYLLKEVTIGTPHIAGYSQQAKNNATSWLQRQVREFCGLDGATTGLRHSIDDGNESLTIQVAVHDPFCAAILQRALPVDELTRQLREATRAGLHSPPAVFDLLRRQLLTRQEFSAWQVNCHGLTRQQTRFLQVMGFQLNPR